MRDKLNLEIIFLFILCALASTTVAQEEKPKAFRVNKYTTVSNEAPKPLTKLIGEFSDQLAKEPVTTKGYIFATASDDLLEKMRLMLSERADLKDRIILEGNPILSGLKEIEFYLVPESANVPYQVIDPDACICPRIRIIGDIFADITTINLTFPAVVKGDTQNKVRYDWDISGGTIIEGQGTATIKVAPNGVREVKVTLQISGVCEQCGATYWFVTRIKQ